MFLEFTACTCTRSSELIDIVNIFFPRILAINKTSTPLETMAFFAQRDKSVKFSPVPRRTLIWYTVVFISILARTCYGGTRIPSVYPRVQRRVYARSTLFSLGYPSARPLPLIPRKSYARLSSSFTRPKSRPIANKLRNEFQISASLSNQAIY